MNNAKTTRRALLSSVVALVICLTMLMGTTFAWFTDTATVSVNTIQSGTLDVALVDASGTSIEGGTLDFVKATGHETEEILWEPGCTYNLPTVYVVNKGNLALKYEIVITGIKGDAKLNEAIEWTITGAEDGNILPGDSKVAVNISGHMKETAGNEYQDLTIDGIAITVLATQYTHEFDSTTDQYDAGAEYNALDRIKAQGFTNVVEVTPETQSSLMGDRVLVNNTVYVLKAGTYSNGLLINATWNAGTDAKIAIYAEDGAKFPNGNVQVLGSGSEVWVENIRHEGTLIVSGSYKNINVRNNTVKTIIVTAGSTERNIVVDGNKVDGSGEDRHNGNDKYGCYIVGGSKQENVTITNNIFKNSYSHCVHLQQGNWDEINIEGNTFDAWGTNGEADRGALKMWGDPVYAPKVTEATDAMKALATEFINNNTFNNRVAGNNCYVNAYDLVINE